MPAVTLYTAIEKTVNITSVDGNLTDPDTLKVYLRAPDGTQETYTYGVDSEVTRDSEGVFVFLSPPLDQVTSRNKLWWIAWVATGDGVSVSEEDSQEVCGLHVQVPAPA